jgi:lactam utilization protein B
MAKKNTEIIPDEVASENQAPAVEKKPKAEKGNWVSMVKDGVMIHGVHPDAVPAHEAVGYKLVLVEKSIEPAHRSADNG